MWFHSNAKSRTDRTPADTSRAPETGDGADAATPSSAPAEPELIIDTSAMPAGQRAAMEVAESARAGSDSRDSFAGRMLMGRYEPARLRPFPAQSKADRTIGDELVARVSSFLAAYLDADAVDETREIPAEVIAGLRDLGIFRMKVPQEYGGLGVSQVNYNRVIAAIASYCGSTAVLVSAHQSIGVPQPLKMYGTDAQKAAWLPRISAGALSAFALTEPGAGSDPAQMETIAVPSADGRTYVLNGEKLWTTNGPIAELLVVMAQTPAKVVRGRERRQITAFVVDTSTPGVEVAHRCDFMGLRAIQNGVMRFTDVVVPTENILWGPGLGLKLALGTLNTGRLTLPAACSGIARQCLGIARAWGNEREQWGMPIGRHEAGREKISHMASTAFAMEAIVALTSHWADEGRDIRIEAGMAKLFCSEECWRIVDMTMQLRGGRGYERATSLRDRGEKPYPVERMMRDCRINTIIEGTSEIMRLFLAREALDPHLRLASDLLRRGTPASRKIATALRLAVFYAGWYPKQVLGGRLPVGGRGPLRRHHHALDRRAHRLAAALFQAMARHGQKLERRQFVLGGLMDIATDLFAMSTTLAYAESMPDERRADAVALADLFCRQTTRRVDARFRTIRRNDQRRANALAGRVLDGDFRWLESGIIPAVRENGRGAPGVTAANGRNGSPD